MIKKLNLFVAAALLSGSVGAVVLDEWSFETDDSGKILPEAVNNGSVGTVLSGDNADITQTDGAGSLHTEYASDEALGLWEDGATLTSTVDYSGTDTIYLRYDVEYDLDAEAIDSGTLIGMGFSQGSEANLAGFALKYTVEDPGAPSGAVETPVIRNLPLAGTISVIAEVNLTTKTLTAWYDTTGNNSFSYTSPAATVTDLSITAFEELQFRATGDQIISDAADGVAIDNMRVTTTWNEITDPIADYAAAADSYIVSISDSLGGAMKVNQMNELTVIVKNTVSPSDSVYSTLDVGSSSDFTIVSSETTPQSAGVNETVTNTYTVVAHQAGVFTLTAKAFSDGVAGASLNYEMLVGSRIEASFNSIDNEIGGIAAGQVEPGEVFDISIYNINSGGEDLFGVANSLSAAGFTVISALTSTDFPFFMVGEVVETIYQVRCDADTTGGLKTFTVTNKTADQTWNSTFQLDVYRVSELRADATASTSGFAGETITGSVTIYNDGNVSTGFSVSESENLTSDYVMTETRVVRKSFGPTGGYTDTEFYTWVDDYSEEREIGFDFELNGAAYDLFRVNSYGFMEVGTTNGMIVTLSPFTTTTAQELDSIRFKQLADSLVVAWGNGTGHEFQAILFPNGTVQYLYETATWGEGTISLTDEEGKNKFTHEPGLYGSDAIEITNSHWFHLVTTTGSVDGFGAEQKIYFTADIPETFTGSDEVTLTIVGEGNEIEMVLSISAEFYFTSLTVPTDVEFFGAPNTISSPEVLIFSNSGNQALSYVISDRGAMASDYTNEFVETTWQDVIAVSDQIVDESDLGVTQYPLGFDFLYFGSSYDSVVVHVDGALQLGSAGFVYAYTNGLEYGENSQVLIQSSGGREQVVVSWINMVQPESGAEQTFQVVLEKDGFITCYYDELSSEWTNSTIQLQTESTTNEATLLTDETSWIETITSYVMVTNGRWIGNTYFEYEPEVIGTNTEEVVHYAESISGQAIQFHLAAEPLITFSPKTGSLEPGETSEVTLVADGRDLSLGDMLETGLSVLCNYSSQSISVLYMASDDEEVSGSQVVQDAMWGSENPVVSIEQDASGSRTLSWPAPEDTYSRTYQVWFTTSLTSGWTKLGDELSGTTYIDTENNDESVIFYRVTVQ